MTIYFDDNDGIVIKADNNTESMALKYWCVKWMKMGDETLEGMVIDTPEYKEKENDLARDG